MDLEDSISSWIGKIREGFDTFCSEAKEILPKKTVQNVQEELIKAAENLKQFRCDLDIFSTCSLDSEHGKGPKPDETEENMDSHAETKSSDEKKDVTESAEMEEKIDLGCDNGRNINIVVVDDPKDMIFERVGCPIPIEVEPRTFRYYPLSADKFHHAPVMESFKFSDDDIHKPNPSTTEESSDSKSEPQSSHYYNLLGEEVRGEVIRDGFLSPLSGSVQSLPSEETEKSSSSSDDNMTNSDDSTPRTINSTFDYESQSGVLDAMTFLDSDSASIPEMPECWSNFTQSPVSNIAESYAEIMQDKERERLVADFIDEDWEIV